LNKAYGSSHFSRIAFLTALFCFSQSQQNCMAASHFVRKNHHRSRQFQPTLLYGVTNPLVGDLANENKLNIAAFKLMQNGKFISIPLHYNPTAFNAGYAGTINSLVASPDGRFLVTECNNTDDGNYRPYFLQYRIQRNGNLEPFDHFGLGIGVRSVVFAPSGHYAYASQPNLLSSRSLPGRILEFHVSSQGRIMYPPFSSVPCGSMPGSLTIDKSGRAAGVIDSETGFLWQYTVTAQGHLIPAVPPFVAVAKSIVMLMVTQDGQSMYGVSNGSKNRIYQLHRRTGGGFSLLMPWAVGLPGVIWSAAISNKHRLLYVSSANLLLAFRIGSQGTLQPSRFLMKTSVGVKIVVDEENDLLYILGIHNLLRTYRIDGEGRLTALGPAAAGYRMSLTVVHR